MIAASQVIKLVTEITVAIIENTMQHELQAGDCQNDQHASGEKRRHARTCISRCHSVIRLHEVLESDFRLSWTVFTSLSPRPDRFTITILSLFNSAATL